MFNTLILADDSVTARMVIKRCLEIAGCFESTFLEAGDGKEALEIARKNTPDMIITDLNMKGMDGAELLKRVKASPKLTDIPVVVVTSSLNEALKKKLMDLGAYAVLSKPVSPAVFTDLLNEMSEKE